MPRIRVRTPDSERIVGTPNCSALTIRLVAYSHRQSLQLSADAQLLGADAVIEHWSWEFPELPEHATIELVSEPAAGPGATFDPPDASRTKRARVPPQAPTQSSEEIQAMDKEIRRLEAELRSVAGTKDATTLYCSFCGKAQEEVRKLIAGPSVFICDECIKLAADLTSE